MATLDELLESTSRTFALAIPLLPEPERLDVTLGYLVFRIADTLEDAENLGRDDRIAGLDGFIELLGAPSADAAERFAARWSATPPSTNADYNLLLQHTPTVFEELATRRDAAQQVIRHHAKRSAEGMRQTLARADDEGRLTCDSIGELREYCYFVAGIVGEMLTELFALSLSDEPRVESLRREGRWFGEGLQLVNILKDADADARDGRRYLPPGVPLAEVFAIARDDLRRAAAYIEELAAAGADEGVLLFARLPRELAVASLAKIEADGHGAKLTRPEVRRILQAVGAPPAGPAGGDSAENEPMVPEGRTA